MKQIAVVMGGPSAEHEVSLKSGTEVLRYIDRVQYRIRAVVINNRKEFFFCNCEGSTLPTDADLAHPETSPLMQGPYNAASAAAVWEGCDVAFLALHGSFGEDGVFQGYLESVGLPYTGSGVYASAVAMNKITSKYLYQQNGIPVAPSLNFGKHLPLHTVSYIAEHVGFPCFVKCPQSGSSRLMGRASTMAELQSLLNEYTPYAPEIMVEKSITGIEFTCGVLDDEAGVPYALPPIEIRPKDTFFTFNAKYTTGASEEIVPAPYSAEVLKRIQDIALGAHYACGCRGLSRTDMIMDGEAFYVLETNTLPGLTANSLIPKAYKAVGGTYSGLIDLIIKQALSVKNSP